MEKPKDKQLLEKLRNLLEVKLKENGPLNVIKFVGGYSNFGEILPEYFTDRDNKVKLINDIVNDVEPDGHIYIYELDGEDIKIWEEAVEDGHTQEHYINRVGDETVGVSVWEYDEDGEMYDEEVDGYYIKLGKLQDKWLNEVFDKLVIHYLL
jgi:hypothetical protein